MNDFIPVGSVEHCKAMLSWRFEESPEVVELRTLLLEGLISSVEFSNRVLELWEKF